jgi:hypothetical protein
VPENPFLLPPGSVPEATPAPSIVPSAAPPPRDPDRYIAVPPSIESATHRIARSETGPTVIPSRPHVDEPVAEETRLSPSRAEPTVSVWTLVLPEGDRVPVDGPILLGRDPVPPASNPAARPIPLVDPGKTMSKTHALLQPAPLGVRGLRVTDLHSTNGPAITFGGVRTVLAPGAEGIATVGSVIELGSFTLLLDGP